MAKQDDNDFDDLNMIKASFFPSMDGGLTEPEELDGVETVSEDDIPDSIKAMNQNLRDNIDMNENMGLVHVVSANDMKKVQHTVDKLKKDECLKFEHGFEYKSNCRICNMAYEDSDLHKQCIADNFNPTKLQRYCADIHGEKVKWEQARNHIQCHVLPIYNKNANARQDLRLQVRKSLRDKEKTSLPMRMAETEEMLCQMTEDLVANSNPENLKDHRENARVVASLTTARKAIWELMLKMMNVDSDPEQMQKMLLNAVNVKLKEAISQLPIEQQKLMVSLLQDNTKVM